MGQDVIQIHQTSLTGDASQHPVHESLEGGWGVAQAETEDPELPQPPVRTEGSLWSCFRAEGHLPVSASQVE